MGDDENEKEFNTYLNKEDVDFFGEGGHLDNTWNQISNFAQRDDALEQVGKGAANFVEDTASGYFSTWGRLAEGAKENAGTGGNGLNDNNLTKGSDLFPKVENPLGKGAIDIAATTVYGGAKSVTDLIGLGVDQLREDGYRDKRIEQQKELFDFSGDLVDRPAPPKGGFNTANKIPVCTQWGSMQCGCGTFFTKLLVPVPHRVFIGDEVHPVATINDWKPVFNIPGFGLCWNILNPVVLAQTIAFRQATGIPMTIPAECSATMFPSPWKPMQQQELIGGVPKLVQSCTSNCWGLGTIIFCHCGQGATPKPYNLISAFAGPDNASMARGFMNILGNIAGNAAAGFAAGGKFLTAAIFGAGEILTHFGDAIAAVYQEDGLGAVISLMTGLHSTRQAHVEFHGVDAIRGKKPAIEVKNPLSNAKRFHDEAAAVKAGRKSLDDLDPTSRAMYEAFYPNMKKSSNNKSVTITNNTKNSKSVVANEKGTKNNSYKDPKKTANEVLNEQQKKLTSQEKHEIESKIRAKEGELEELERKKKADLKNKKTEIEKAQKLKAELETKKNNFEKEQKRINNEINANNKKIGDDNSGLTKQSNDLGIKIEELESNKKVKQGEVDKIEKEKKKYKEEHEALLKQENKVIETEQKKVKEEQGKIDDLERQIREAEEAFKELDPSLQAELRGQYEAEIKALKSQKDAQVTIETTANSKIKETNEGIKKREEYIAKLDSQIAKVNEEIRGIDNSISDTKIKKTGIDNTILDLKDENARYEKIKKTNDKHIKELNTQIEKSEKNIKTAQNDYKESEEQWNKDIGKKKGEIDDLNNQIWDGYNAWAQDKTSNAGFDFSTAPGSANHNRVEIDDGLYTATTEISGSSFANSTAIGASINNHSLDNQSIGDGDDEINSLDKNGYDFYQYDEN